MWISKSRWDALERKVLTMQNKLNAPAKIHEDDLAHSMNYIEEIPYMSKTNKQNFNYFHLSQTIHTEKVGNLTIEELARYVIDNKPIERTEKVEKKIKLQNGIMFEIPVTKNYGEGKE